MLAAVTIVTNTASWFSSFFSGSSSVKCCGSSLSLCWLLAFPKVIVSDLFTPHFSSVTDRLLRQILNVLLSSFISNLCPLHLFPHVPSKQSQVHRTDRRSTFLSGSGADPETGSKRRDSSWTWIVSCVLFTRAKWLSHSPAQWIGETSWRDCDCSLTSKTFIQFRVRKHMVPDSWSFLVFSPKHSPFEDYFSWLSFL